MEEKYIQRINMQLYNRLIRIEKENQNLKRAIKQFEWLIETVKNLKTIMEIINYGDERKSIEQRRKNI